MAVGEMPERQPLPHCMAFSGGDKDGRTEWLMAHSRFNGSGHNEEWQRGDLQEERLGGGGIRHHTKETLSSPYLLKIKVFLGYREDSRWSKGA